MAVSFGVSTTFVPRIASLGGPSPSISSIRSRSVRFRTTRTVTYATASKPASGQAKGIMKPRPVSPEMQEFVGAPEIARTEALKVIWAYIKANNLQDPENKKIIVCDDKLKTIFAGNERVGFLEIAKLISPHFLK